MSRHLRPLRIDGDVAYLALSMGYEAAIDVTDVPLVSSWNWSALVSPRRHAVYAVRVQQTNGKQQMLLLHRVLIGAPKGAEVDHIDGDGLNNRRTNLRLCSHAENQRNTGVRSDNKSGFKGVFFETRAGRWRAEISTNGKTRYLGYFDSPELAHNAYRSAAAEDHASFARTK